MLPKLRFRPIDLVGGCPVRELVQMPFVFSIAPDEARLDRHSRRARSRIVRVVPTIDSEDY